MRHLDFGHAGGLAAALLVVMVFAVPAATAQQAQAPAQQPAAEGPTLAEGNAHMQAGEWEQAVAVFEAITKREPQNGGAWFRLGLSRLSLQQFGPAAEAFQQSRSLNFAPMGSAYNISRALAAVGMNDMAFQWLDLSVNEGFSQVQSFVQDSHFTSLLQDARYAAMLKRIQINAAPCEHLPEYRQFDFWVGDWEVHSPQGQKVGENRIIRLDSGCVLLEQWAGAQGGTGTSINYYDHTKGKYVQQWVSSNAGMIPAEGGFSDGAMRLTGEQIQRNGTRQLYRGTWTPLEDGRVRQLLELSSDEGKTWTVWFEGFYSRKQPPAPAQ